MEYVVGQQAKVVTQVTDLDGQPVDATVQLTTVAPDSTIDQPAVTHDGTGAYSCVLTLDQSGYWLLNWAWSGAAVGSNTDQIWVRATGLHIVSLDEVRTHLRISAADTDSIQRLIPIWEAAEAVAVDKLGNVVPVAITETRVVRGGALVLYQRPVMSVASVTAGGNLVDAGAYSVDAEIGRLKFGWLSQSYTNDSTVTVVYTAGRAQPWPRNIMLGVKELIAHMWRNSQIATGGQRAVPSGQDQAVAWGGLGYTLPNRVLQLWNDELLAPAVA